MHSTRVLYIKHAIEMTTSFLFLFFFFFRKQNSCTEMLAPTMAATALLILVSASGAAKAGSGLKVSDASTCRFTFQVGFCGGGAPVISATPHTTAGDCCAKCTAHSGCKSWTVNNGAFAFACKCNSAFPAF